eukprot:12885011-Prorocentrum_lima.AAC.1
MECCRHNEKHFRHGFQDKCFAALVTHCDNNGMLKRKMRNSNHAHLTISDNRKHMQEWGFN